MENGTLYVVATPIGNLEDITFRALRTLREVDLVLCEDTRVTKKLLSHYDIHTPCMSFNAHSEAGKTESVLERLTKGESLALVSDAGTPTVSDPGAVLVAAVRARFGDLISIVAIPGPSALVAALSIAGVPADRFIFLGFPPHKKGRKTFFETLSKVEGTAVFYESPHRIMRALETLRDILSSQAMVVVVREITKVYEEVVSGTAVSVLERFVKNPETVRGEFVVIIRND